MSDTDELNRIFADISGQLAELTGHVTAANLIAQAAFSQLCANAGGDRRELFDHLAMVVRTALAMSESTGSHELGPAPFDRHARAVAEAVIERFLVQEEADIEV